MNDREALKLALKALKEINKLSIGENAICLPAEIDTAMDAIREALAQPEQEPVAYTGNGTAGREADVRPTGFFFQADKRQPEQEPVAVKHMTKDEALQLALNALIECNLAFDECKDYPLTHDAVLSSIAAIREALAQPPEERNFCPRCGKSAGKNAWDVHTCSLPEENT